MLRSLGLTLLCCFLGFSTLPSSSGATTPPQLTYQGRLFGAGSAVLDSTLSITFTLYADSTGGTALWSEVQSVEVDSSLFNVTLGSATPITSAIFTGAPRWLTMQVAGDTEMVPRVKLVSVPYAMKSEQADTSLYAFQAARADTAIYALTAGGSSGESYWAANGNSIYNLNNGYVGIGTQTPETEIEVAEDAGGTPSIRIRESAPSFASIEMIQESGTLSRLKANYNSTSGSGDTGVSSALELERDPLNGGLIHLSTGTNALNRRLSVTASGNVGIGITNPYSKLHVHGTRNTGTDTTPLTLSQDASGRGSVVELVAGTVSDANPYFAINSRTPAGTPEMQERLRIDQNGNLGIGTANPIHTLHVRGGSSSQLTLEGTSGAAIHMHEQGVDTDSPRMVLGGHSQGMGIQRWLNASTWQATYFLVRNDGNVGVGTLDPTEKLQVSGIVHSSTGGFKFPDGTVQTTAASGGGTAHWAASGNDIHNTNPGNVGIGTSAPDSRLHIVGAAYGTPPGQLDPLVRVVNSGYGHGILVRTGDATGAGAAVEGQTTFTGIGGGIGVQGSTRGQGHPDGSAVGVQGLALSPTANGGSTIGVLGKTFLSTDTGTSLSAGVQGQAPGAEGGAPHNGRAVGVIGDTWSRLDEMFGVSGSAKAPTGWTFGVIGHTHSTTDFSAGVKGIAEAGSGRTYGVVGHSESPDGLGIYSEGPMAASGPISMIVATSSGPRQMYVVAGPDFTIPDAGESHLVNGRAHIDLDPTYLELVAIDDESRMSVTITFYGPHGGGWYVERGRTGFDVIDPSGSSTAFSWEVKAKRRGFEKRRLELVSE